LAFETIWRGAGESRWRPEMKLKTTLQSPFALVLQGFLVGTILVFAPSPFAPADAVPAPGSAIAPASTEG
jgi:hypothetical protein